MADLDTSDTAAKVVDRLRKGIEHHLEATERLLKGFDALRSSTTVRTTHDAEVEELWRYWRRHLDERIAAHTPTGPMGTSV